MKIKALVGFSGGQVSMARDDTADVPQDLAEDLIKAGFAEGLEDEKPAKKKKTKDEE